MTRSVNQMSEEDWAKIMKGGDGERLSAFIKTAAAVVEGLKERFLVEDAELMIAFRCPNWNGSLVMGTAKGDAGMVEFARAVATTVCGDVHSQN